MADQTNKDEALNNRIGATTGALHAALAVAPAVHAVDDAGAVAVKQAKLASDAEAKQWRNIQKVVRELAAFCFGSADQPGSVSLGAAYTSIVNSLTAKDGLQVKLEPLASQPQATPLEATSEQDEPTDREALIACLGDDAAQLDSMELWPEMAQTMRDAAAMLESGEQMGGAQVAKPEQSAPNYGDNWHSLTCDGTCSPPCAEARPTADAGCLSPLQRYVWAGTPVEPLKHLTAHEGPFYACDDVRDFIAKSRAAEGAATSERKPLTERGVVVYVCRERDIECGRNPRSWCSTCPQRHHGIGSAK